MLHRPRILLFSLPWQRPGMPSIQLGLLKAHLDTQDIDVDTRDLHLEILEEMDCNAYQQCESLIIPFGALADPPAEFQWEPSNVEVQYLEALDKTFAKIIADTALRAYDLVAFSVSTSCQYHLSVALAKRIRSHDERLPVLFGGFICSSGLGSAILKEHRSCIDYVISGEGETSLVALVRQLQSSTPSLAAVPGLVWCDGTTFRQNPTSDFLDLTQSSTPDYSDYFATLERMRVAGVNLPEKIEVPIESSRGCQWNRCHFCNHNAMWSTYRRKSAQSLADELDLHFSRYGIKEFYFVDNNCVQDFGTWSLIQERDRQFHFSRVAFMPNMGQQHLEVIHQVGVREILVGIESFSNDTLRRMNKNTTVIKNLNFLKHCQTYDIKPTYNLLINFPSETAEALQETIDNIDYADIYWPPILCPFELREGSSIYEHPEKFNIELISESNNKLNRWDDFLLNCAYTIKNQPVAQYERLSNRIHRWRCSHNAKHLKLFAVCTQENLIIDDFRDFSRPTQFRLGKQSRTIYSLCAEPTKLSSLYEHLPKEILLPIVEQLIARRLLFHSRGEYLALAPQVEAADPRVVATRRMVPAYRSLEIIPI